MLFSCWPETYTDETVRIQNTQFQERVANSKAMIISCFGTNRTFFSLVFFRIVGLFDGSMDGELILTAISIHFFLCCGVQLKHEVLWKGRCDDDWARSSRKSERRGVSISWCMIHISKKISASRSPIKSNFNQIRNFMLRSIVGFGVFCGGRRRGEEKGNYWARHNPNRLHSSENPSQMDRKSSSALRFFRFSSRLVYCSDNDRDASLILYRHSTGK